MKTFFLHEPVQTDEKCQSFVTIKKEMGKDKFYHCTTDAERKREASK